MSALYPSSVFTSDEEKDVSMIPDDEKDVSLILPRLIRRDILRVTLCLKM